MNLSDLVMSRPQRSQATSWRNPHPQCVNGMLATLFMLGLEDEADSAEDAPLGDESMRYTTYIKFGDGELMTYSECENWEFLPETLERFLEHKGVAESTFMKHVVNL